MPNFKNSYVSLFMFQDINIYNRRAPAIIEAKKSRLYGDLNLLKIIEISTTS